jgi:hypothetical protein
MYGAELDTIMYTVNVLKGTWLGIGYGMSMTNTDEVIFAAGSDVDSSDVYDVYSTTEEFPSQDTTNIYTTTYEENGDFITFTSTRPITPPSTDDQSYTISIGTPNDMIWAYGTYTSSSGYNGVAFHGTNYSASSGWTMTLSSDGSVSSEGDIEPAPTPEPTNSTLILNIDKNGSTLSATATDSDITYLAHVIKGTYLAIGYGTSMSDTDMVFWAAGSSESSSNVYDAYSKGEYLPIEDSTNIYTSFMK